MVLNWMVLWETQAVRPPKTYHTGHATVTMCERIMGDLDLFKASRACYESKKGFDIHPTTTHSVQSPLVN